MNNTYKIKRYREQRVTFNSPILYSTVVEYISDNNEGGKVSKDKNKAYNFESLEDAVKILLKLNKNSYEKEWRVVEISEDNELYVDEDTINNYRNKQTIEKYKQDIVELNRKIVKLEAGSPYKRVTVEDVKIGVTLFVVRAMNNGTHSSTEKVIIKSDIKELDYGIKSVEVDSVRISGNMYYSDGNLYLSDAGIIPNNYNKSKTFKTLEEAEAYVKEIKQGKWGEIL